MKKIGALFLFIALLGGFSVHKLWLKYKHRIADNIITYSVSNLTDSLYSLSYDSIRVDEINGEAYFEHVLLSADSSKIQRLTSDDHLPDILLKVYVKSISANGLDIPLALSEGKLYANQLILNEPLILITYTGNRTFKKEDSIELFRKIVGNFNSIHAKSIEIINAKLTIKDSNQSINTQLTTVNISLNDIIVDSTKDYKNVICYFINNIKASAKQLYIRQPARNSAIIFDQIVFNAVENNILIDKISTLTEGKHEERFILNSVRFDDLKVNDFIHRNTINVGNISTGESVLTLFINKKDTEKSALSKLNNFDFPDDFFDKIKIGGISIGKSRLIIRFRSDPQKAAIIINGFEFHLAKIMNISERNTLRSLLDTAKWVMQADHFAILSKDKKYNVVFEGILLDKDSSRAFIRSLKVKPAKSKDVKTREPVYQKDVYNIKMTSIQFSGLNVNQFINESSLDIREVALQADVGVYHDRIPTKRPGGDIKKFPHQLIRDLEWPLTIHKLILKNSAIGYTERSKESKESGKIFFTHVVGVVTHLTNNPVLIQQHPVCEFKVRGLLFEKVTCTTEGRFKLDSRHGDIELKGQVGSVNFNEFNSLTKPLALFSSIGKLNSLDFTMKANDTAANGNLTMLYSNLKLTSYKMAKETHHFETKKAQTLVSNLFVKNNNPSEGITRSSKISVRRDPHKSFFNFIWKGVNDGIQGTILNSKVATIKKQATKNR